MCTGEIYRQDCHRRRTEDCPPTALAFGLNSFPNFVMPPSSEERSRLHLRDEDNLCIIQANR
jgi:hypothetical protein